MKRPPDRWSIVIAAIAVAAGVRALIWMMEVPRRILSVWDPHHASGESASLPYASAVHALSNPRRSASLIASRAPDGGPLPQYPAMYPSETFFDVMCQQ
jgi:hypothetical protein